MRVPALLEEMKTYRGRDEVPADFDDFWNQAIAALDLPVAYRLIENILRLVVRKSPTGESTHYFFFMIK